MKRIYIIALMFAILTGIAVYNYAKYLEKAMQKEMEPVIFAVRRIPENTLITTEMTEVRSVPKETVNPLSFSDLSKIKGTITNSAIEAGEQILITRLNQKGTDKGGLAYNVPEGKRAVTIEVTDITGVAGYIKKGDFIDVIAALTVNERTEDGKTEKIPKTFLLLQNTEVLETGTQSAETEKKTGKYTNITVALEPEEAVKLFYAEVYGKLTAVLRPVLEDEIKPAAPYAP